VRFFGLVFFWLPVAITAMAADRAMSQDAGGRRAQHAPAEDTSTRREFDPRSNSSQSTKPKGGGESATNDSSAEGKASLPASEDKPTPSPAARGEFPGAQMAAAVIEVSGSVDFAPVGVSVLASDGWKPVKLGDRLESGHQVRTGLRSYVNLQFGSTTTIAIRSASHASIDQCYRSATSEVVRMGLGYGTVRGGSTEGQVRSDVIIDSTVATLAKRGTDGWQMQVQPGSQRFRISLAREGLVEASRKAAGSGRSSRTVRPGEYATDKNVANLWIKQDIFDRNVTFFQSDGLTNSDAEFVTDNTRGYAVMSPGGGSTIPTLTGRSSSEFVLAQLDARDGRGEGSSTILLQPVDRPEGNFGTGSTFRVLRSEPVGKLGPRTNRVAGNLRHR